MTYEPTHSEQAERGLKRSESYSDVAANIETLTHAVLAIADQLSDLVAVQHLPITPKPRRREYCDMVVRIDVRALNEDEREVLAAELYDAVANVDIDPVIEIEANE